MKEFLGGVAVGAIIFGLLVDVYPGSYHNLAKTAITECEKTLPRNQTCNVVGVPNVEKVK